MSFNFRGIKAEVATYFKQVLKIKNSWILLPGLIAILLVYASHYTNQYTWVMQRGFLEPLALWLVPIVLIILLTKAFISRDPLIIYLAVLALVFLVRELDDTSYAFMDSSFTFKSKQPVNVILLGMALWAAVWHEKLFDTLNRFMQVKVAMFGVFWTYFLSQLIARRAFRGVLPEESLLNVSLEEMAETSAHLFFFAFALFCFYVIPNKKKAGQLCRMQEGEKQKD